VLLQLYTSVRRERTDRPEAAWHVRVRVSVLLRRVVTEE